jgi:hypothetical protein
MELKIILSLSAAIQIFNLEADVIIYDRLDSEDEDESPDLSSMARNYNPEHEDMADTD